MESNYDDEAIENIAGQTLARSSSATCDLVETQAKACAAMLIMNRELVQAVVTRVIDRLDKADTLDEFAAELHRMQKCLEDQS